MLLYVCGNQRTLLGTLFLGITALSLTLTSLRVEAQVQGAVYRPSANQAASYQKTQATVAQPANAVTSVKSYREWKLSMVQDSEARIKSAKENLNKVRQISNTQDPNSANSKSNDKATSEAGLGPQMQSIQDQIAREQIQLSLAQELTITDYFVGYLAKQKSLGQAIKEVSGKLTPEEVAELMTAYANNFFQSRPQSLNPAPRADSDQY